MSEEAKWKEYIQDFMVEADGVYESSSKTVVSVGGMVTKHKLFADHETLEWEVNKGTDEITGVKYLGR